MKVDFFKIYENKKLTLQKTVTRKDTYEGLLSTASLTRFMLDTAWELVAQELPQGYTSVAAQLSVTHEEPTVAGETVTVTATVVGVELNRILITFEAEDETGVIAHGRSERHIVEVHLLKELADKRAEVLRTIK
jgi:predicted thioesterase